MTDEDLKAEEIYKAYPRRIGKALALKAIRKSMSKYGSELLLTKTREFSDFIYKKQEKEFIPHPQTFFNQRRFLFTNPWEWVPSWQLNAQENNLRLHLGYADQPEADDIRRQLKLLDQFKKENEIE